MARTKALAERAARASPWRTDLWWVAAATVGGYLLASALVLQESLTHRLARFESWNIDEMPFNLTVLACGLAWYALRRRRGIQARLGLRMQAQARNADLPAHNRELAQQLMSLQESERLALARELRGELGQSCTAIRVETALLRHCAAGDSVALLAAASRADRAAQGLQQLIAGMGRAAGQPRHARPWRGAARAARGVAGTYRCRLRVAVRGRHRRAGRRGRPHDLPHRAGSLDERGAPRTGLQRAGGFVAQLGNGSGAARAGRWSGHGPAPRHPRLGAAGRRRARRGGLWRAAGAQCTGPRG